MSSWATNSLLNRSSGTDSATSGMSLAGAGYLRVRLFVNPSETPCSELPRVMAPQEGRRVRYDLPLLWTWLAASGGVSTVSASSWCVVGYGAGWNEEETLLA